MLFIMMTKDSIGQNLKNHQWKNRVLLVLSNSESNRAFKKQMLQFTDVEALKERKLLVYQIFPDNYLLGKKREKSTLFFEQFMKDKETFRVVLIGLDGGIKYSQTEVLSRDKLFDIIDSMPMRQAEIRRN